jgi:hypothetical protein
MRYQLACEFNVDGAIGAQATEHKAIGPRSTEHVDLSLHYLYLILAVGEIAFARPYHNVNRNSHQPTSRR